MDTNKNAAVTSANVRILQLRLKRIMVPFLIPDFRQQTFYFCLLLRSQRKQRCPRLPTIVAVVIAGVFYAADSKVANNALVCTGNAFLLFFRKLQVVIFPGEINLLACLRCTRPKGQNADRIPRSPTTRLFAPAMLFCFSSASFRS